MASLLRPHDLQLSAWVSLQSQHPSDLSFTDKQLREIRDGINWC
jgi:pyridoxine/pyridoxamine 5'-phosphate oxidase